MKEARASCEDKPLARMFHRSAALAVSAEASVCQNQKKTASSRKLRSHVSHVDRPLGSPYLGSREPQRALLAGADAEVPLPARRCAAVGAASNQRAA